MLNLASVLQKDIVQCLNEWRIIKAVPSQRSEIMFVSANGVNNVSNGKINVQVAA